MTDGAARVIAWAAGKDPYGAEPCPFCHVRCLTRGPTCLEMQARIAQDKREYRQWIARPLR